MCPRRRVLRPRQPSPPRLLQHRFDLRRPLRNRERQRRALRLQHLRPVHSRQQRDLLRPRRQLVSHVRGRHCGPQPPHGPCQQETAGHCQREIAARCRMFRESGPADRAPASQCVRRVKGDRWGVRVQTQRGRSSIAADRCQQEHALARERRAGLECCRLSRTKCRQVPRQSPESRSTRARLRRASGR